jgi:hypothetical protein
MFDCRRSDQTVGEPNGELSAQATAGLSDSTIDRYLEKRTEEERHHVGRARPGYKFGSRDDRVMNPVFPDFEFVGATQVVDEDVRVEKEVSHDATRLEMETRPSGLHRRISRGRRRHQECRRGSDPRPRARLRPSVSLSCVRHGRFVRACHSGDRSGFVWLTYIASIHLLSSSIPQGF